MKTKTFKATVDGKEIELLVRTPSLQDQKEGQKAYNQAFTDAVKSNSIVRAKLDDLLTEQGLWNDTKQARFTELQKEILQGEKRLAKGGFSLNEAKDLAIKIKAKRDEIRDLISVRTSLDNHTAEGQADNARFNYLVSVCLVYNDTKQPYFNNLEDYLNRATEEVAILGAQNLANMIYGLDNNYESNLPENKFLKKYRFVDDKLRLIDKKGRLVDEDGRLIDENGRYINEQGVFVDKYGNEINEDGEYIVTPEPFLDDDGNPIVLEDEVVSTKTEEAAVNDVKTEPNTAPVEESPAPAESAQ